MKREIRLVLISSLRFHEAVCRTRVMELVEEIKTTGYLRNPVVVDKKTLVILDGHHRVVALRKLGVKKVPVFLVDYKSDKVRVYLRRKELMISLIKEVVIKRGLSEQTFPYKTTRHFIKSRPYNIKTKIRKLI